MRIVGTRDLPVPAGGWAGLDGAGLRHAVRQVVGAGGLDSLLTDAEFLVHADPGVVVPLLSQAAGEDARAAGAVYSTSSEQHHGCDPVQRRWLLALDAARRGCADLAQRINAGGNGPWAVRWAAGGRPLGPGPLGQGWCYDGSSDHSGRVAAVATTVLDGRPVAVTGSHDETVRIRDLATGHQIGQPLSGHADGVFAVATAVVEGRPVAVAGGEDEVLKIWDLATGRLAGPPLTGHCGTVEAVTTTVLDGRPVAVTGSGDETLRIWDLAAGDQIGEPITGHLDSVVAVATTMLNGSPVAVTGSADATTRVWDLTTGRAVSEPLTGHTGWVNAVATTVLDGRPVAVTGGDETARLWDLTTGREVGEPMTGHLDRVVSVATTVVNGRAAAVTGSWDKTVRVWDLTTGRQMGDELAFPVLPVHAVTITSDGDLMVGYGFEVARLSQRPQHR